MPDLRGLFLRGHGGQSAALGVEQIDTMRPITGDSGILGASGIAALNQPTGALFNSSGQRQGLQNVVQAGFTTLGFDSSRLGLHYSGPETRPVNMAVRYLIKALK